MEITLIAVGKRMPNWVNIACDEYRKRLPPDLSLQLIEISLQQRSKNSVISQLMTREGEQILAVIPKGDLVIALEVHGKAWDTPELARQLQQWRETQRGVSLLIGGPDGLASNCLQRAALRWSLSPLTLPHPLVRVVVIEQIYRAWSILNGHPYHR